MKRIYILMACACALAFTPAVTRAAPSGAQQTAETASNGKCRVVDMCWYKNGKRFCFKKRVCD